MVKNLLAVQETQVWSLSPEDPLKKGMAMLPKSWLFVHQCQIEIRRQSYGGERVALLFCQAKGEDSRLPPQDLCPTMGSPRGLYREAYRPGYMIRNKIVRVLHLLLALFQNSQVAPNWIHLSLVYRSATFFLKSKKFKKDGLLQGRAGNVSTRYRM